MRLSSIFLWINLLIGLVTYQPLKGSNQIDDQPVIAEKIVSISGTITEILFEIGLGEKVVGVDVTSNYPEAVQKLPKVGHNRNISAEGIISLGPELVLGMTESLKPEVFQQLKQAGIEIILFEQEYSIEGTKQLIKEVCNKMDRTNSAAPLIEKIDEALSKVKPIDEKPKVLFIYARGVGTLMVAGQETSVQKMISLSGGENAVTEFKDFKPLTAEALVSASPDALLLFESGLESLAGTEGLESVPGVMQTPAGENKRFISMDGVLLSGFGPRVGEAVSLLNQKLREAM